jgi:regulator of sirC expression with transglutaminase-like and TPR domain
MSIHDFSPEDSHVQFTEDREFQKLIRRQRNVNLPVAALELARDFDPQLRFEETLAWIDLRAQELANKLLKQNDSHEALQVLVSELATNDGFHGNHECFKRPESSFLNKVVETRMGLPITLSLVYMAVGNKAGIPLTGVSTPMHFILKHDSGLGEPLFIDAYRGRIMTQKQCLDWLSDLIGIDSNLIDHCLRPAAPRAIVVRMLNNLKSLFIQQENWSSSWQVQLRLSRLNPTSYEERRDLGFIALKVGRPGLCAELLSDCLNKSPKDERKMLTNYIDHARAEIAICN